MQTDNHLNAVAATHHAVGAKGFKDVIALGFRHIDERDAQPGGAVIDAFDILRAAKRLKETRGLTGSGVRGRRGLPARGAVIGFAVELDVALGAAWRF